MNNFTRAFASETFKLYFAEQPCVLPDEVAQRIALVLSEGCEGCSYSVQSGK